MKYAKPVAGTEARNKWAVRGDRLAVGLVLNEGTGSTVNNIGRRTTSPWGSTFTLANSPTWTADSLYGQVLDFNGGTQSIPLATVSGDTTYKRGSIGILFKADATANRNVFGSGSVSGTGGQFQLRLNGTTTLYLSHFAATNQRWDFAIAPDIWYFVLWTWGEKTLTARLFSATQEIAGTVGLGSPTTSTAAYTITGGQTVRVGSNTGSIGFDGRIGGFGWWDWQLTDSYLVNSLANDFFEFGRTVPSATINHYTGFYPFNVTATGASYRAFMKTGGSDPTAIKVEAASDNLFQNIVATATSGYTSAGSAATATLSGLSAGTSYYIRQTYAPQSTGVFLPLPGGVGRLRTKRARGVDFTFGIFGDGHISSGSNPGSAILNGYFQDNLNNGPGYIMGHMMRDMQRRGDLDFVIDGGDDVMQNDGGAYTTEEIAKHYCVFTGPISHVGPRFFAMGNWEGEAGDNATTTSNGTARQNHLPNPTDGDSFGRYYGFEWGDAAILTLECEFNEATGSAQLRPVGRFGASQKTYAETFLANTTCPWKIIVLHKWPAGVKSGISSGFWYGRSSGAHLYEDRRTNATLTTWERNQLDPTSALYDATATYPNNDSVTDEIWLMELAEEYGCVMFMGHDHVFCWCRPEDYDVQVFHWPTPCSIFHFGAIDYQTVSGVTGAATSNKVEYYGDQRQLGQDLARRGVRRTEAGFGYLVVSVSEDELTVKLRSIFPNQSSSAITTKGLYSDISHLGKPYVPSAGTVTLDETPEIVHCIVDEVDYNPNNMTSTFAAQRYVMATDFSDLTQSTDWETPYNSAVVTYNAVGATGNRVYVNATPRDSFQVTLQRDEETGTIIAAEPVLKSVTPLDYLADRDIIVYQQAELPTIAWFCVDNNNGAIDLSGATLSFKVYDRFGTTIFSATTADDLDVGGELNNRVTLTVSAADTATAGGFRYDLWRTSGSDLLLARGAFEIRKAVK